mgnify:CR=1 FL=1
MARIRTEQKLIAKIWAAQAKSNVCIVAIDGQKRKNAINAKARWFTGGVNFSHVPKSHASAALGFGGTSNTGDMLMGKLG